MVKYFNLKKGSEKVFGGIIKVDISVEGLEKLSNPNGDWVFTPWTFKHIGVENGEDVYEVNMPNEQAVNTPAEDSRGIKTNIAAAVSTVPPSLLKLILNKKGELRFHNPEQKGFHLHEVSEKTAQEYQEREKNWALQRAYIFE